MKNLRWSWWGAVAAAVVLVVGFSGFAIAQSTKPSAQINACATKKGGALRVAAKCRKTERRVRWATTGPQGPQGTAGAAGRDGAPGAAGAAGPAGTGGTNGTDGTTTGETFYAESLGQGSNFGTTCGAPSGPSITFTAPAGAYVQIMAQVDLQRAGGIANAVCLLVDGGPAFNVMVSTSLAYETRYLSRGSAGGVTDVFTITPFVFPVSAGSHTVSLQYSSTGGTSNFRNRKLWVTMFQPTS
jgi:hypothetical protein